MLGGLFAASISMLAWGSYFVPMKRVKEYNSFYFQLIMCAAIFIFSLLISIFYKQLTLTYFGIISGLLWSSGNILSALAVKKAGLSRSAPLWMGTGIVVSVLWGLFFFHEVIKNITLGLIGVILIIAGIYLISSISGGVEKLQSKHLKNGILLALISGLLFGTYLVPFKISDYQPLAYLFSMSVGILTGGILIYLFKRPKVDKLIVVQGSASGILWNVGNIASFFAVSKLGVTVGFPLTQLALFVSVIWGLAYFNEIKRKSNIIKLITASLILFSGAILLTISK